jgi:iron complex outermembrane recepter protein
MTEPVSVCQWTRDQREARHRVRSMHRAARLAIALTIALSPSWARGQTSGSSLSGQVLDASGSAIPDAAVRVRTPEGRTRVAHTDQTGRFVVDDPPAGPIELDISKPGFATEHRRLASAREGPIEVRLKVATVHESVIVTAPAPTTARTATGMDTPVADIPQAIQVVGRDLIEEEQITRAGEATRNVSSVMRAIGFTDAGDRYTIRGMLADYSLKNGFKNNTLLTLTDMANVERIEVLKGPASTLYGRIEPGGVVNTVTKKPLATPRQAFNMIAGSYDYYRAEADVTGPLDQEKRFLYRINGSVESTGSYRDLVESRTYFLAPAFTWQRNSKTALTVEAEHLQLEGRPDAGVPMDALSFGLPLNQSFGSRHDTTTNTNDRASVTFSHRFDSTWTLDVAASGLWIDATRRQVSPNFRISDDRRRVSRTVLSADEDASASFARFNVAGRITTGPIEHGLLFGAEPGRERYHWLSADTLYPDYVVGRQNVDVDFTNLQRGAERGLREADSVGVYAHDQISYRSWLKFLGGVRFDGVRFARQNQPLTDAGEPPPAPPPPTSPGGVTPGTPPPSGFVQPDEFAKIEERPHAWSPRVGLLVKPIPGLSVYASYSRSFNPLLTQQTASFSLRPTIGTQYETGVKLVGFESRLEGSVALFDVRKSRLLEPADIQIPGGTPLADALFETKGVEMDMTARPQSWLHIIFAESLLDGSSPVLGLGSVSGSGISINAPRHSGSLWVAVEPKGAGLKGLRFGAGLVHASVRRINPSQATVAGFDLPQFARYDAMIGYGRARVIVQLNVKNLTGGRYYETDGIFGSVFPAAPRVAELGLRLRF